MQLIVALAFTFCACQQVTDINTDRKVTTIDLSGLPQTKQPEITDFSPKYGWMGDRITITGKNFINVQKVLLDSIPFDSVVVESPTKIIALVPGNSIHLSSGGIYRYGLDLGLKTVRVTTQSGTASAKNTPFAYSEKMFLGKVTLDEHPLDSVIFSIENLTQNFRQTTAQTEMDRRFGRGWYSVGYWGDVAEEFIVQPFKNGYRFFPPTRKVRTLSMGKALGEQDFVAQRIPVEQTLFTVTSITPTIGKSYSKPIEGKTGTDLILKGTGFSSIRKIFIAASPLEYGCNVAEAFANPAYGYKFYGYREATNFKIESDTQVIVQIPSFGLTAQSGLIYRDCLIYLVSEEGSVIASQKVDISYM